MEGPRIDTALGGKKSSLAKWYASAGSIELEVITGNSDSQKRKLSLDEQTS